MEFLFVTKLIALVSLILSASFISYRWLKLLKYPKSVDFSIPKSSSLTGVVYAFTLGMAPWAKESTRRHWILYLRGILFHLGIFSAIFVFLLRLFSIPVPNLVMLLLSIIAGLGATMGFAGIVLRLVENNLRMISNLDDHISLWLVSVFLLFTSLSHFFPSTSPVMFLSSSIMLIYIPFSKIRHFLYFFFSRLFFGNHLGKRGIIKRLEVAHGE